MNLKDKYFTTGLILVLICVVSQLFPKFVDFVFWGAGVAGVASLCWWTWQETK